VRLDLVVGPNGAGKSTFVRLTLAPVLPRVSFVNADVIAQHRWPDDAEAHSYEAARIAAATRDALMERREPLIAETVYSHPSKVDLLRAAGAAGYYTAVHVVMVPEKLAVARVAARVAAGGHTVPEDKIRGRYRRLWPLVADAIELADTASVYDNSRRGGPRTVAAFSHGFAVGNLLWPLWAPDALTNRWPDGSSRVTSAG
jgi:predicted ABC-type ATPase